MKRKHWLLGVVLMLVLLSGCRASAARKTAVTTEETTATVSESQEMIRVACVGDSITYGYDLPHREQTSYPARLQELLGENYQVVNFGVGGQTVQFDAFHPYRDTPEYQQSLVFQGDILIFMMGSNDTKQENWQGADAFRQDLEALLDSYLAGEEKPEILLCTPAAAFYAEGFGDGVTAYLIQPEVVKEAAELIREVARERGYPLADIHELTKNAPELFMEDGVHPNEAGAETIAREIYRVMTEA